MKEELNELNILAPINRLSYGVVSRNIIYQLDKANVRVNLFPIFSERDIDASAGEHEKLKKMLEQAKYYNPMSPSIRIWHQFALTPQVGCGLHMGFPIFELDTFNDIEKHQMHCMDHLFVPSHWAKQVVIDNLGAYYTNKCTVVPLGVDTDVFCPDGKQNVGPFRFFTVGKWEYRKGHDIMLECFDRAFEPSDDVALYIMATNPFVDNTRWTQMYANMKLRDKVRLVQPVSTHADVAQLMNFCDVGLFLSRAEGWNLPLLEAMACGKHVICTNNTAHTEFVDTTNADSIILNNLEKANDGTQFFPADGVGNWYSYTEHDKEKIIEKMRAAYKQKEAIRDIGNTAGMITARKFSWKESAKTLYYKTKELYDAT